MKNWNRFLHGPSSRDALPEHRRMAIGANLQANWQQRHFLCFTSVYCTDSYILPTRLQSATKKPRPDTAPLPDRLTRNARKNAAKTTRLMALQSCCRAFSAWPRTSFGLYLGALIFPCGAPSIAPHRRHADRTGGIKICIRASFSHKNNKTFDGTKITISNSTPAARIHHLLRTCNKCSAKYLSCACRQNPILATQSLLYSAFIRSSSAHISSNAAAVCAGSPFTPSSM
jgi:hypothetical protein